MDLITPLASSSGGNCYLINDGCTKLLIECGIPYKEIQKALDFKMSTLDAVLCTHEHGDHVRSIKDVLKAGIDCYLTSPTIEVLKVSGHRVKEVEPQKQFEINSFVVLPFPVQHDASCPVGYFLVSKATGARIIFITDTYYVKFRFPGLTHIMVECNYSKAILDENIAAGRVPVAMKKRLLHSHFSLEHVKEFLQANDLSKVQAIHLLHLSDNNSDAALFKREIQAISGCEVYVAER